MGPGPAASSYIPVHRIYTGKIQRGLSPSTACHSAAERATGVGGGGQGGWARPMRAPLRRIAATGRRPAGASPRRGSRAGLTTSWGSPSSGPGGAGAWVMRGWVGGWVGCAWQGWGSRSLQRPAASGPLLGRLRLHSSQARARLARRSARAPATRAGGRAGAVVARGCETAPKPLTPTWGGSVWPQKPSGWGFLASAMPSKPSGWTTVCLFGWGWGRGCTVHAA